MGVCVTMMVMMVVTMYKFVSYTGLDCSAFFFWDFLCSQWGVSLIIFPLS